MWSTGVTQNSIYPWYKLKFNFFLNSSVQPFETNMCHKRLFTWYSYYYILRPILSAYKWINQENIIKTNNNVFGVIIFENLIKVKTCIPKLQTSTKMLIFFRLILFPMRKFTNKNCLKRKILFFGDIIFEIKNKNLKTKDWIQKLQTSRKNLHFYKIILDIL